MAKMIGRGEWASDLCSALGENPRLVRCIDLHVGVDSPIVATIEKYVDSDNKVVIETIKKVVWVEEPQEEGD